MLGWSPRPFSVALLSIYWLAVWFAERPLLVPVLASAWAFLFAGLLSAAQPWKRPGRAARWALVLALPAAFLLPGPIGELFYWPFGALSYLPALGAACYAVILAAGPGLRGTRDWFAISAALSIGAASVELGAFLALGAAPCLLLAALAGPGAGRRLRIAASAIPILIALAVLFTLMHGRAVTSGVWGSLALYHHVWPSLGLAIGQTSNEFLRPENGSIAAAIAMKALLFFGARACLAAAWPQTPPKAPIVAILAGLAVAAFLSTAGANYVFGALCCERHATYRQALFMLMAIAAAGLWRPAPARLWGPVLLALALLIYLPGRIPDLLTEYRMAHVRAGAWKTLFRSGLQPGPAPLDYVIAPSGPLLQYEIFPPGAYRVGPQLGWSPAAGAMLFFGKTSMIAHRSGP
jgi:hypothetical protein